MTPAKLSRLIDDLTNIRATGVLTTTVPVNEILACLRELRRRRTEASECINTTPLYVIAATIKSTPVRYEAPTYRQATVIADELLEAKQISKVDIWERVYKSIETPYSGVNKG